MMENRRFRYSILVVSASLVIKLKGTRARRARARAWMYGEKISDATPLTSYNVHGAIPKARVLFFFIIVFLLLPSFSLFLYCLYSFNIPLYHPPLFTTTTISFYPVALSRWLSESIALKDEPILYIYIDWRIYTARAVPFLPLSLSCAYNRRRYMPFDAARPRSPPAPSSTFNRAACLIRPLLPRSWGSHP